MNGSQRRTSDAKGVLMGRSGTQLIPLEWRQEWFTTICLMITLAAMIFLMLLSIYLVVTKPGPSSVPGDNGGRPLRESHADRFATVHGDVEPGRMPETAIRAGNA